MSIESRKGSHALHPLQNKAEFIALYERLLNALDADEAVYFADAVHPECQTKPSYGWVKAGSNPAVTTTAGRGRVNIHGAHNRYYPTQTQFADAVLPVLSRNPAQRLEIIP